MHVQNLKLFQNPANFQITSFKLFQNRAFLLIYNFSKVPTELVYQQIKFILQKQPMNGDILCKCKI